MSAIAKYFKFAERGTTLATESEGRPDHLHGHGLHHRRQPEHPVRRVGDVDPAFRPSLVGSHGPDRRHPDHRHGRRRQLSRSPWPPASGSTASSRSALVLSQGLTPAGAMGVIVLEGIVVTRPRAWSGLREAIMSAVPLALKRAIGVGIGLFILFIGFVDGGLSSDGRTRADNPSRSRSLPDRRRPTSCSGSAAHHDRGPVGPQDPARPSLISILVTTVVAIASACEAPGRRSCSTPDVLDDRGRSIRSKSSRSSAARRGADDLQLHAHRLLRHDGHGHRRQRAGGARRRGWLRPGRRPHPARRLRSALSSAARRASARTRRYIESAAGVAEGGRTGFASVVTGVLFLAAILLAPLAGIVPASPPAPVLVLVGYLMFSQIKDIDVSDVEDGFPALLDDDPHAADVQHHRRHRRRVHLAASSSRSSRARPARSTR